jgi:hypothetical protein
MNKRILTVLAAGLLVMGLGGGASALTLNPGEQILSGPKMEGENGLLDYLDSYNFAGFDPALPDFNRLDFLYKADVGKEASPATVYSGPYAGSYLTFFSNEPLDPQDAVIDYIGGPFINSPSPFSPLYLIVKDGNMEPAWYLFDIREWNGTDDLVLNGFWPEQGAISHVEIYGSSVPTPEPATMLLFGAGLAGLAGIARRKKPGKNE